MIEIDTAPNCIIFFLLNFFIIYEPAVAENEGIMQTIIGKISLTAGNTFIKVCLPYTTIAFNPINCLLKLR